MDGINVDIKFLSPERISTLLSLSDPLDCNIDGLSDNILFDFNVINESILEFLNRKNNPSTTLSLSAIINKYNLNFDLIYAKNKDMIKRNLYWVSTDFKIMSIIDLLYSNDNCDYLLCLLQITSIFENSLANLHFQVSSKVPNMLTDLIQSKILNEILNNHSMINLLMVFIGFPDSLNLRNLSWHGYLWELNFKVLLKYCKFLTIILWNIGEILSNNQFQFSLDFFQRFKTTNIPEFDLNGLPIFQIQFKKLHLSSLSIQSILETIDLKFLNKEFYESLCLMLPTFEFYMRMLYINVNNLSNDLSIAVSHEYFVTEDVVISEIIEGNTLPNRFMEFIGEEFSTLVAEIFMYPMGPRLKDIISHGEVTIVDHDLSSWAFLMRNLLFYLISIFEENKSDTNFQVIHQWIKNFQPRYHTFTNIKNNIIIIDNLIFKLYEKFDIDIEIDSSKIINEKDLLLFNEKIAILFRDNQIITDCGLTLKIISNQITHIQDQMKIILENIDGLCDNENLKSRYSQGFCRIFPDLRNFLFTVNIFCRKLFIIFIMNDRETIKLMKKPLVKMIKRTLMNCDKIRSYAVKHKWDKMENIFYQFITDFDKIIWEDYVK